MAKSEELPYSETKIQAFVDAIEYDLMTKQKFQFSFDKNWKMNFPKEPGVYAIFEKGVFVYIGETAELRARMYDLRNTYNHSFRNKIGKFRLKGVRNGNKYSDKIEKELNAYFEKYITVSFHALSFGRKEVEVRIVSKKREVKLINSVSIRGVKKVAKPKVKSKK